MIKHSLIEIEDFGKYRYVEMEQVSEIIAIVNAHPGKLLTQTGRDNFKGGHKSEGLKWYGCSYDEAIDRFTHGAVDSTLEKFALEIKELVDIVKINGREYFHEIEGEILDVGEYIRGVPDCWLKEEEAPTLKNLDLYVDIGATGDISPEQQFNKGVAICSLIDILSDQYNLQIFACGGAATGNWNPREVGFCFRVPNNPLDIELIKYMFTDISFTRRIFYPLTDMIGGKVCSSHRVCALPQKLLNKNSYYIWHASGPKYRGGDHLAKLETAHRWILEQIDAIEKMYGLSQSEEDRKVAHQIYSEQFMEEKGAPEEFYNSLPGEQRLLELGG